jgi:BRCA1 C Terminus (BRCT) domain
MKKFKMKFECQFAKDFSKKVTHLVVYPIKDEDGNIRAKRNIKYLKALLQGAYIVSYNWVLDSIVANEIKDESPYIVDGDDYHLGTPTQMLITGGNRKLFHGMKFSVVGSIPPVSFSAKDIKELVVAGGGKYADPETIGANEPTTYKIIISNVDTVSKEEASGLIHFNKKRVYYSHKLILDSISSNTFSDMTYRLFCK